MAAAVRATSHRMQTGRPYTVRTRLSREASLTAMAVVITVLSLAGMLLIAKVTHGGVATTVCATVWGALMMLIVVTVVVLPLWYARRPKTQSPQLTTHDAPAAQLAIAAPAEPAPAPRYADLRRQQGLQRGLSYAEQTIPLQVVTADDPPWGPAQPT